MLANGSACASACPPGRAVFGQGKGGLGAVMLVGCPARCSAADAGSLPEVWYASEVCDEGVGVGRRKLAEARNDEAITMMLDHRCHVGLSGPYPTKLN